MTYHFNYSKISISWMSVGMTANERLDEQNRINVAEFKSDAA